MNIVQITPGAGGMFCGGCLRDNALVAALRRQGHGAVMVPLYLPLTLDEENQAAQMPIFFGGINVYLEQKVPFLRRMPKWLHALFNSRWLLERAAASAAKTQAAEVGEMTVSMLRGDEGNQARELDELVEWLRSHERPDLICLSNVLLAGLARRLRNELRVPVACLLSGEDAFVDSLPPAHRQVAWDLLVERSRDFDGFVAPSQYYARQMRERLGLNPERVRVISNGINLDGYAQAPLASNPPVLGFFSRMCQDKGLEMFVDTVILLRERKRVGRFRVRIGGGLMAADEPFVRRCREKLEAAGCMEDVEFCPNLDRAQKVEFYRSLTVFSVPALYGESFGLYVIEALAAGVPVVQPRHAAFPEILDSTGGGLLCEGTPAGLAEGIEQLLLNPQLARTFGERGRQVVHEQYSVDRMADHLARYFSELAGAGPGRAADLPLTALSKT